MKLLGKLACFMKKVVMRVSKQWFRLQRKKKEKTDVLKKQNFKATGTVRYRVKHYQITDTVTEDQKEETVIFSRTGMWKW